MKRIAAAAVLLLWAAPAWAAPPKLSPEVKAEPGMVIITATPADPSDRLGWYSPDGLQFVPPHLLKDTHSLVAFATKPGRYRLIAWADSEGYAETVVVVGDAPEPEPEPDDPPGPDDPDPPPTPGPAPIPEPGLRVLIVYETADQSNLSAGHRAVLFGRAAREYLDSVCVKEGTTAEWRIYDKDIDVSRADETWRKAMGRPRDSLPWLVVSNGTAGFEGPLPDGVDALKELIGRYAD